MGVLLVLTTVVETLHHNLVMDHPTLALVLTVLPTPDPALTVLPTPDPALTVLPTPDPDLVLTVLPTLALAPVLMDHQLLVQVPVPLVIRFRLVNWSLWCWFPRFQDW